MSTSDEVKAGARTCIGNGWLTGSSYDLRSQAVDALVDEGRLVGAHQAEELARLAALVPEQAAELVRLRNTVACDQVRDMLVSAERENRTLRARVAELEAQRDRRRGRLLALQNDALAMRGSLSPNGGDRKVPFELGETLTPVVDWLIARVGEQQQRIDELVQQRDDLLVEDAIRERAEDGDEGGMPPYVSMLLPARDAVCARPGCGHSGADHHHGDTKCWAHLPKGHGEPITICSCASFVDAPHPSPCRWPASPDCLCGPSDVAPAPAVVVVPLGELQRMSGDPLGGTEGGAS